MAELVHRAGPIVVFLLAITVTAEIAERAGVFALAGHHVARLARHRTIALWALFSALAVLCTVFLSLDTTAVLLTPVGLAIAAQTSASPVPFALTTLWIANTGSLLLPVSNLTNLFALSRFGALGVGHAAYLRLAAAPAAAAVIATLVVIAVVSRRELRGRYGVDEAPVAPDRILLVVACVVCVVVGPLFAAGISPAAVAVGSAAVLLGVALVRRRDVLRGLAVPWLMAAAFVVVAALVMWAGQHGLTDLLRHVVGRGTSTADLLRVAGTGAVAANLVDNLPAYLALEPAADDHPLRLLALLIGVDAGPLVTPWASLATLLWLSRCRAAGVRIAPTKLAGLGLACAVCSVGAATLTLCLVR